MKPLGHLVISAAMAGGSYMVTDSVATAIAAVGVGVLIDADHLVDYACYLGRYRADETVRFRFREFLRSSYVKRFGKLIIPLHSYELLVPLSLLLLHFVSLAASVWITAAWLVHLFADQYANKPPLLAYSLAYRAMKRFSRAAMRRPAMES